MKFARTTLITAACLTLFSTTALGAPLVEESFVYDDGALNTQNGGTGFAGAWTNTRNGPTVSSPGFTAGTLDVDGGYARGAAWSGVARPIGSTLSDAGLMTDGSTLWFSAILGLDGQNAANADINIALTNAAKFVSGTFGDRENLDGGASQGIGVTHSGGNIRGVYWTDVDADTVAERTESAATSLTIGGANPASALVVGKIDWGVGGETLTLYAPDANLNLGAPIATLVTPAMDQSSWTNLAIQFKDQAQVDEIRFGADSTDVLPAVPEPTSLALLGLGGLLIARRRRD